MAMNSSFVGGGLIGLAIGYTGNEAINQWVNRNPTMYFGISATIVIWALWSAGRFTPN